MEKNLSMLYPDRKNFHVSEVEAFFYTCCLYFAMKNEVKTSKKNYSVIEELNPDSPGLWRLESQIIIATSKQKKKYWKW
jgi:hypothetical protein